MNLLDLMGVRAPDKYGQETIVMMGDAERDIDNSYILVLQPDQDDRVLTLKPTMVGSFIVIKNDSEYQVVIKTDIKTEDKKYTLLAGNIVKLYILGFGDFIAIDENVPDFIPPILEYKIQASNVGSGDYFGYSVSMNDDGTKCVVGSRYEDAGIITNAGAVYIFSWNGSSWVEDQMLHASDYEINGASAYLGYSISMNGDGTKVISGASRERSGGTGSGATYIFGYNGTTWVEEQKLVASDAAVGAYFGEDVDISDDGLRCIVGAFGNTVENDGGAAYVYFWNGTSWIEEQKILASDSQEKDYFGYSVSISGDGTRCIVGAYCKPFGTNIGAAYIFSRSGTTWIEEQKILASDGVESDYFGSSISISGDGTRCIVSALYEDDNGSSAGAAYIFSRSGTTWAEEQKILASDGAASDNFSNSVSMSGDGTRCIVGANKEDVSGSDVGAAYIFSRSGATWIEDQKIVSSDGENSDHFGWHVSISSDGTRCIVGARYEDTGGSNAGSAYIFHNI